MSIKANGCLLRHKTDFEVSFIYDFFRQLGFHLYSLGEFLFYFHSLDCWWIWYIFTVFLGIWSTYRGIGWWFGQILWHGWVMIFCRNFCNLYRWSTILLVIGRDLWGGVRTSVCFIWCDLKGGSLCGENVYRNLFGVRTGTTRAYVLLVEDVWAKRCLRA